MNNLYFKGLSADSQELDQIKGLFQKNGLIFTNVFYGYAGLPLFSKEKLDAAINDEVRRSNPLRQDVNIVCHSMGCNLGVLSAEKSSKIKKMVLISPEFGEYSKQEQSKMQETKTKPTIQSPFGEQSTKIDGDKVRSLIVFNKTKPYATLAIERVNIPTLIIYSKDDIFIPQNYLNHLADRKDNIDIEVINSKLHNPLTSVDHSEHTMTLIKKFLK